MTSITVKLGTERLKELGQGRVRCVSFMRNVK